MPLVQASGRQSVYVMHVRRGDVLPMAGTADMKKAARSISAFEFPECYVQPKRIDYADPSGTANSRCSYRSTNLSSLSHLRLAPHQPQSP